MRGDADDGAVAAGDGTACVTAGLRAEHRPVDRTMDLVAEFPAGCGTGSRGLVFGVRGDADDGAVAAGDGTACVTAGVAVPNTAPSIALWTS